MTSFNEFPVFSVSLPGEDSRRTIFAEDDLDRRTIDLPLILPPSIKYQRVIDIRELTKEAKMRMPPRFVLFYSRYWSKAVEDSKDPNLSELATNEHRWSVRNKHQRLCRCLKIKAIRLRNIQGCSYAQIAAQLDLPYTTVRALIIEFHADPSNFIEEAFHRVPFSQNSYMTQSLIKHWWMQQDRPFTASDVAREMEVKYGIHLKKANLIQIMKKGLGLSYKRVNSRPVIKNMFFIRLMKSIFVVELANMLKADTLMVSIDEVAFSRTTKTNYSW